MHFISDNASNEQIRLRRKILFSKVNDILLAFTKLQNKLILQLSSHRFPKPQPEAWFLALGDVENNQDILALKRVSTVRGRTTQQLNFWTPEEAGRVIYTLYVMSDSYLGLDQQYDIHLEVMPNKKK